MALTHHSVRTCFLWRESPLFGDTLRQQLWASLLRCLEVFQSPRHAGAGNAADPVDESVKTFLEELLKWADNPEVAARLGSGLRESRPVSLLWEWYVLKPAENGEELFGIDNGGDTRSAVQMLFKSALTQALAAYSLGQIAFLFGHLWLAKKYSIEAYNLLQEALSLSEEDIPARNLEFLTITLLIEVLFHSQGYDTLRNEKNEPYVRRIAEQLAADRHRYLQGLPDLKELGLLVRNGTVSGQVKDYLENFWNPIPTDRDTKNLRVKYLDSEQSNPLAVAYVLSRRNRAGMLYYRYRDWNAAAREFLFVIQEVEKLKDEENPVLVPIFKEAKLYLGRIRAHQYKFAEAEKLLGKAQAYFHEVQDEFAENKAMKAEAELLYRQSRLAQAEAMFQKVSATSREKGFVHDWASAEMYLAKIESGYGFQATASERFGRVSAHFSQYDAPRETIECLFWSTAAQARRLNLEGHPRESVIDARALLKVYRRLFEGVRHAGGRLLEDDFLHLREALEKKRDPDVTEAMLDLRLGQLPAQHLVEKLWRRLDRQSPPRGENRAGGSASLPWDRAKEDRLVGQVLRLIDLQQDGGSSPRAQADGENRFPKMTIRDQILTVLEAVAKGKPESARVSLSEAQRGLHGLKLGGGLVPFLVDLSQFFLQRDSFIALLLLLLDDLDHTIRHPKERGQDSSLLKAAYRSLTKYLVVERNFYLGPPSFQTPPKGAQPLWDKLERSYGYSQREWQLRHERALLGGHGLFYPGNAVGLGWVESVETGAVILRIAWVEEVGGDDLRAEHFERLSVPTQVAAQGHAEESMAPVVLVGRQGVDAGDVPWTAHRVPLDLEGVELFRGLQASPWYEPVLETWRSLFERFIGQVPVTCESPVLTAADWLRIDEKYGEFARSWFGDRFQDPEFEQIFGVTRRPPLPPPREPVPFQGDQDALNVLEDYSEKFDLDLVGAPG